MLSWAQGIGHVAGIGLLGHKQPDEIAKSVNAILVLGASLVAAEAQAELLSSRATTSSTATGAERAERRAERDLVRSLRRFKRA